MRYVYALIACCMYGAMCGATTGAAQEMKRAEEERDAAQRDLDYYRARVEQSGIMLNACIKLYSDASRTEDRCARSLKACWEHDK